MNSKILSHIKKIIIASAILVLCGTNAACAFSFGGTSGASKSNFSITSLIELLRKFKKDNGEYSLSDFQIDLEDMQATGNIDVDKIQELFNKLPSSDTKSTLQPSIEMFANISEKGESTGVDVKELLSKLLSTLINALKSLIGGIGGSSSDLPVEPKKIEMQPKTAVEFAGKDYNVKLVSSVYIHVDENGKPDSNKWAFLIHPNSYNGEKIAGVVGPFYYEKGYNIFAPDLRGAGDSEGETSLGFLDSLDVYDWLTILNRDYNPEEIIVHGISLGAATTNFLSGIDQFMNNGPVKMNTTIKPIRELKVVGLIEDCGYTDMEQFSSKKSLIKMGIGLTEENYDYYHLATNSLKYCDLPMLIIHGTKDIIVKVENADTVKNTVKGYVEQWLVEGKNHAFIVMGQEKDAYREHVHNFIDKCTNGNRTTNVTKQPVINNTDTSAGQGTQSFLQKLISAFKK